MISGKFVRITSMNDGDDDSGLVAIMMTMVVICFLTSSLIIKIRDGSSRSEWDISSSRDSCTWNDLGWCSHTLVVSYSHTFDYHNIIFHHIFIPHPSFDDQSIHCPQFGVAILLFLSHTLDGIDGKQARRTQSSNPLGELFDHGSV